MHMPYMSFLILRGSMYSVKCNLSLLNIILSMCFIGPIETVIASRDRQQVWIRLIINALETNFFLYSSDQRINYINMVIIH